MANFYKDNKALQYHLHHPLMEKIVGMKERDYTQCEKFDYAPVDFEDAIDSYDKILEITGEIAAEVIAPNAESTLTSLARRDSMAYRCLDSMVV